MNIKNEAEKIIYEGRTGCGEIFRGKYYHLDYQPSRAHDYKCLAIELITRRNDTEYAHDFETIYVRFKQVGFFVKKEPFEKRLKDSIDKQIKAIQDKEVYIDKKLEEAQRVRRCQIKIDHTVANLVGKSVDDLKPFGRYNK